MFFKYFMKLFQKIGIIILMILSLVAVLVMVGLSIENFMFAMQPRVIDNKSVIKKIVTSTIKLSDSVKNTAVSQTDYNIYIVTSNSLPYLYWKSVLYKDFNDFEVSTSTIISSSKKLLLKLKDAKRLKISMRHCHT